MLRYMLGCEFNPLCIVDSFFMARMEVPWRRDFGPFDTALLHMRYAGFLVLPFAVAILAKEGRMSWRSTLVALLGLMMLLILVREGGRRHVGLVGGATALTWILLRPQIRWRHLWQLAGAAALLLLLLQAIAAWRDVGFGTGLAEGLSIEPPGKHGLSVDRNFGALIAITETVPERYPHTGFRGLLYEVTFPIPRQLFPWKPEGRGFDLRDVLDLHVSQGWSWTASAVGDFYLIGGWGGLMLGGMFFGSAANRVSRLLEAPLTVRRRLAFTVGTMILFIGLRALHEGALLGFAGAALWGLLVLRRAVVKRVLARPPAPRALSRPRGLRSG
jgi:hypothetical protein